MQNTQNDMEDVKKVIFSKQQSCKCKTGGGRRRGRKSRSLKPCTEKPYVQRGVGDLWTLVDPDVGENLRKLMETEFGLQKREAEEYVINEKMRIVKSRSGKKKKCQRLPCFPFPPLRPQPPKSDFFCPMSIPCNPCDPCGPCPSSSPPPRQPCWPPDFIVELQRLLCQNQDASPGKVTDSVKSEEGLSETSAETEEEEEKEGAEDEVDEEGEEVAADAGKPQENDCRPPDILDILKCMLNPPPCPPPPCPQPPLCPAPDMMTQLKEMLCSSCPPPTLSPQPPPPCPAPDMMTQLKQMLLCSTCPPSPCPPPPVCCPPCLPCSPGDLIKKILCSGQGGEEFPIPQGPSDCPCPPPNYEELLKERICPPLDPLYPCYPYIADKPKKRKRYRKSLGLRYYWFKEMTDLLMLKLNDYVAMMLSQRRPQRARCIAESILQTLCDITGEKCTLNIQKTRVHKILVFLADRISLWLTELSCACDESRRELCGKKDNENGEEETGTDSTGSTKGTKTSGSSGGKGSSRGLDSKSVSKKSMGGMSRKSGKSVLRSGGERTDDRASGEDQKDGAEGKGPAGAEDAGDKVTVAANFRKFKVRKPTKAKTQSKQSVTKNKTKVIRGKQTIPNKKPITASTNRIHLSRNNIKPFPENDFRETEMKRLAERKQLNEVLSCIISSANLNPCPVDTTRSNDVSNILGKMIDEQIKAKSITLNEEADDKLKKMISNIGIWIDSIVKQAERDYLLSMPDVCSNLTMEADGEKNVMLKYIESELAISQKQIDQLRNKNLFNSVGEDETLRFTDQQFDFKKLNRIALPKTNDKLNPPKKNVKEILTFGEDSTVLVKHMTNQELQRWVNDTREHGKRWFNNKWNNLATTTRK